MDIHFEKSRGALLTVTANNFVGTIELDGYKPQRCSDPIHVDIEFYVAHFHTHYSLTYVSKSIRIATGGGASRADKNNTTMPGLVYDYIGNLLPEHDINKSAEVFQYGFKRKTLVGDTPEPI